MRGEIRDLQRRLGITAVYVTHDQEEAMAISDRIAVMNKGAIEQLGTAQDLYRHPASVFVARFIGRSNLIPAVVSAIGAGRAELTIAGVPHAIEHSGAAFRPGQSVLANVRPEAIAIGARGDGLGGIVITRTYLGEKIEYDVEVAGARLQVVRFNPPASERFAPGDAVGIRLPREGVHLLTGNDA